MKSANYTEDDIHNAVCRNQNWAIDEVSRYVTPLIKSKLFAYSDWEDVRQQCLMNIVVTLRKIDRVRSFWGLVRKITVCHVINHNRRLQTRRAVFEEPSGGGSQGDWLTEQPSAASPHSEDLVNRELFLYIYQRISEVCRRLFYLLFIKNLTYQEAASELDISEGNLRVRLKRCREKAVLLRDEAAG